MRSLLLAAVAGTALFAPTLAHADQCAWITKDQAIAGARELGKMFGSKYLDYCEPCGDTAPIAKTVKAVSFAWADGSRTDFEVKVNGQPIDLAYAYVKVDTDDDGTLDTFQNLAATVGCPASDVTFQLDASAAGGAKSDEAEDFSDASGESGGCSTTHGGSTAAFALLALGMVIVRRRRRA